jgi:apolipoprotein N-acyltransferase
MRIPAVIASALILALSLPNEFAPWGLGLPGFFCLAPYFAALSRARSYREAALLGFIFGVFSHGLSSYWLLFFNDFALWTIGLTTLVYGVFHIFTAFFLYRAAGACRDALAPARRNIRAALRPLFLACVWTAWEYVKSTGFLGYPWGLIAYSLNNYPRMIQIADITGVYGLSFLLSLSSAVIAEAAACFPPEAVPSKAVCAPEAGVSPRAGRGLVSRFYPVLPGFALALGLFIWTALYGGFRLARPVPVTGRIPMLLVQHNGNSWTEGELETLASAIRLSREGMAEGGKPALLVWSETVLVRPFEEYRPFFTRNPPADPLIPFLAEAGTPLLTGAPELLYREPPAAANSALLIENGRVAASYAKQHLVPFAESIPFIEYPWMRSFMRRVVGLDEGWAAGRETVIMKLPCRDADSGDKTVRFGVPICFEDAFAPLCREFFRKGADILINLTNDSWSKTVSAETQHFAAARFRTVENRRVLVRSANGGITAVIDAEGRIAASLPPFTEAYLAADVPIQKAPAPTVYAILGDWVPLLCGIFFLGRLIRGLGKPGFRTASLPHRAFTPAGHPG